MDLLKNNLLCLGVVGVVGVVGSLKVLMLLVLLYECPRLSLESFLQRYSVVDVVVTLENVLLLVFFKLLSGFAAICENDILEERAFPLSIRLLLLREEVAEESL